MNEKKGGFTALFFACNCWLIQIYDLRNVTVITSYETLPAIAWRNDKLVISRSVRWEIHDWYFM